MQWILADSNEFPPEPQWVKDMRTAVENCPGHLWVLALWEPEDDCQVGLSCERCPATMDDLYPDGHSMLYLYAEDGRPIIEEGHSLLKHAWTIPVNITINSWYHSNPIVGEEWEIEMEVTERGPWRPMFSADEAVQSSDDADS